MNFSKQTHSLTLPDCTRSRWDRIKEKFVIPPIRVKSFNTVQDYFNLPKSERLHKGFWYKEPWGWPINTLDDLFGEQSIRNQWSREISKAYPVQWFFREWLFSWDNPAYAFLKRISMRWENLCYNTHAFLFPWHKRTTKAARPFKYTEAVDLIEDVNIALILDFYYDDYLPTLAYINWQACAEQARFIEELKEAIQTIEADIPAIEGQIQQVRRDRNGYPGLDDLEIELDTKKTELLVWLAKNRGYFWT
jgi:hypothetical protein